MGQWFCELSSRPVVVFDRRSGGSKGGAFMSVHSKCVGSRHAGAAGGHVYGGEKSMIGRGWVDGWQSGRGGRGRSGSVGWGALKEGRQGFRMGERRLVM